MAPARREALILAVTATAALAAGGLAGALALQSTTGAARLLNARFADTAGRQRQIGEWQGRIALVNFWATWCAPCRDEMPMLDAAEQQYRLKGFSVIGIGIDSAANVQRFSANYAISYQLLIAGPEAIRLMKALGNPSGGLPFSVVLGRSGEILQRKLGAFGAPELRGVLETALR